METIANERFLKFGTRNIVFVISGESIWFGFFGIETICTFHTQPLNGWHLTWVKSGHEMFSG